MAELTADEEFAQLLYVVQQYRKKPLTPPECETFAYLYEGLHMPAEFWNMWQNTVYRKDTAVCVIWKQWH